MNDVRGANALFVVLPVVEPRWTAMTLGIEYCKSNHAGLERRWTLNGVTMFDWKEVSKTVITKNK